MLRRHPWDYGDDICDRITIARLLVELDPEDLAILVELFVKEETQARVAEIITEVRGKSITGSGVRWRRDEILAELRKLLEQDGINGPKG